MAYVYTHTRLDSNEIFYVGIGSRKKRAYDKADRNRYWYHIVNKHGYKVTVTHEDVCWEEACAIEKYLISFYGRADLKAGTLVNMTDGGDGTLNKSEEAIRKISERAKLRVGDKNPNYGKKHSEKTKELIRIANTGPNNPRYGKPGTMRGRFGELNPNYGREHSPEVRAKMREKKIGVFDGEKNPMYGKAHSEKARELISRKARDRFSKYGSHLSKKVIDTATGIMYESAKDAAEKLGLKATTLRSWLNGWNKNPTTLKYLS